MRSIAPDANPYLAIYTLFRTGLEGPLPGDDNDGKRPRTRFLPDNIYDAIRMFKASKFAEGLFGPVVHEKFAELKLASAERCPKALGSRIKRSEIIFHHLIVDGSPLLRVGGELDIILQPLGIHETARVAWKQELAAGLRLGVLRTGPLKGYLNQYRISDVFIGLQRTLKTGILEVRDGPLVKQVFFRSGHPVYAASSQEKDRLGDVLLKKRIINRNQYDRAAEVKRQSGERYAVILVNLGFVKPQDLFAVVKIQVQRIIGSIFLMSGAA